MGIGGFARASVAGAAGATMLACGVLAPVAGGAPRHRRPVTRIETTVRSAAPDRRIVRESYVRLRAPLPASDGPRPAACDWISYLRFRSTHGPRAAYRADAVFVTMPGIFAGASMLDQFARNTVRAAAARGRHVEVWTLDRRSNCLEDHHGTAAAARHHDPKIAFDYYFHGGAADGRRFAGYKSSQQAAVLSHVGLSRTVRDVYIVIARNVPRRLRTKKVFCGGHSLGGPLTTAFADWDFDGNPRTTADAGYNQCAGYFALDTRLSLSTSGGSSSSGGGGSSIGAAQALAAASNGSPYVNAPPFTPETIQAVAPTGLAAFQQPHSESHVAQWTPNDANFQATYRTLFSRDAVNAVTQVPSIRDFRVTNEVALAAIFDDNSAPVTILRTSLGTYTGGPVAEKSFPAPYGSGSPGGLVDGKHLMIPTAAHGPLYSWWNYSRVGRPGTPRQVDSSGQPFTSRPEEVSDIHQFARVQFEAPADFSEQYFPTRLLADEGDAEGGDRSGDLANLRYDGIPKRPALYADAAHGIEEGASPPPPGPSPYVWFVLRGYNHIDVASAAWRQNDGHLERESHALAAFGAKVAGKHRRHHHHHHR
jgi:hypothetical protein